MLVAFPTRGAAFPWTVFVINLAGSFALGVLLARVTGDSERSHRVRALLGVGFCGGFTTFSTWMTDAVLLARADRWFVAALSIVASLGAGLAAVALGMVAASRGRRLPAFDPTAED